MGGLFARLPGNPDQNSQNQDSMADNEYTLISQVSATENCKTMLVQNSTTRDYAFKYFYTSWPVPNARLKSCMDAYLKLTCPHIIRIQTYIIDTAFTLITDMANGPSLRSLIIKRRIAQQWFTSTEIWLIIIQLLEGVRDYQAFYADVGASADTPPNLFLSPFFILVSDEQRMKLQITEFYQTLLLPSMQRLYATSGVAPPEVSKHLPITASADVWMVGAILYELLTLQQLDLDRLIEMNGDVVSLAKIDNLYPIDYEPLEPYQSVAVYSFLDHGKAFRYRELYSLLSCMLIVHPDKRPSVKLLLDYTLIHAPDPMSPGSLASSFGRLDGGRVAGEREGNDAAVQSSIVIGLDAPDSALQSTTLVGVKTELHKAVEEGNLDKVFVNLQFARSTDIDGNTALVYAIKTNNEEAVKVLAQEEIGVLTGEGYSPLHLALLLNHMGLAKYLDASYDMQFLHGMELWIDEHGISNLMRCVCERNLVGVYYYSDKQQKLQDYDGKTALIKAVLNYNEGLPAGQEDVNLAIIKILRPYEARMKDKRGRTALMYAAECGYLAAIDVLSGSEAGLRDDEGRNSLEIAFSNGKVEAAQRMLLLEPVPHSCPDRQGLTDLMKACIDGDAFSLFCHMTQTRATDINGNTALMHCVIHDRPEFIPKLSDEHRMINRITGHSAMMLAVQLKKRACFEALVKHESGLKSSNGMTALMMCASQGFKTYVGRLLNVETNIFNGTWNAMTYAIAADHHEIISLLAPLELNLPAVLKDYDALTDTAAEIQQELEGTVSSSRHPISSNSGYTPLMFAAQQANINAVWGLRDKYLGRKDQHGFTALVYATQVKSLECCKLLADERDIFCNQGLSSWFYAYQNGYHDPLDIIRPTIKYANTEHRLTDLHMLILRSEVSSAQLQVEEAVSSSLIAGSAMRSSSAEPVVRHKGSRDDLQPNQPPNRLRRNPVTTSALLRHKGLSTTSSAVSLESSLVLPEDSSSKAQVDYLREIPTLLYMARLYTKSGETALMLAAKSYRGKVDKNLLALEAGMRDSYGRLASCIAIERGNTEFLAEILPYERDVLLADGFTELMLSVLEDDYTTLMQHLKYPEQQCGQVVMSAYTALNICIYCGKNALIPLFMPYEADIEIHDKLTPLDLAYATHNVEAILLLMPYTYTGGRLALSQCLCTLIRAAMKEQHLPNERAYDLLAAFHSSNYRQLKEALQDSDIQSMKAFKELADSFQTVALNIEYLVLPDAVFDDNGNSQLHIAALASDARLATAFVHLHSLRNKKGETALMLAARSGSEAVVDILLSYEAEMQDNNKMTATEHSIVSGTFHKVPNLYAREKAFLINDCELSPLMLAVLEGDTKSMNAALKYAKLHTSSGITALHMAIYLRQQTHTNLLKVEKGILTYDGLSPWFLAKEKRLAHDFLEPDPTVDALGCTELHRAAIQNNSQQVRNYLPLAQQYNTNGRTSLMEAALAGSLDAARILVDHEHGMRAKARFIVDNSYFDEATALMFAAAAGHEEIVQLLIPYECKMHEACNGKTALMAAAAAGRLSTLKLLIDSEGGLTGQNGWTALMSVVSKQYVDCVAPLLEKEAGMRDSQGNCALVTAISNGNMDIVRVLAPLEAKIMGKSTLMRIWKSNITYDEIVRYVNKLL
ncbi:Kinase/ NEK [Giardia duodenalis assemblage B]|uniref:Kinase/ NEK n=1 Tax=Giardia duodenalis assemblage B TaxID=1394984 RepID=A0A132NWK6_GIAIN|nr:Kinase/ NEK [Giardia intestinalis assemblage B]